LQRIGKNSDDYAVILTPQQEFQLLKEGHSFGVLVEIYVSQKAKDLLVIPQAHVPDFIA
jgi:hypothetical protein